MSGIPKAHLRIARPTRALAPLLAFYRDGLGFELLGSFEDHDGFSGVMLGHEGAGYHLEFTVEGDVDPGRAPSREHLLVFYLPDADAWRAACARLEAQGFAAVEPHKPYWAARGRNYEDPDGYGVILQNSDWSQAGSDG